MNKDKNNGFSLLELIVAVGILAVLSVTGIITYTSLVEEAKKAEGENTQQSVSEKDNGEKKPINEDKTWDRDE